jgi:hypothetical protein
MRRDGKYHRNEDGKIETHGWLPRFNNRYEGMIADC